MIGGQIMFQPEAEVDAIVNDLYGENIHIQAIVGKNGAGKTSMLDIIYRIIIKEEDTRKQIATFFREPDDREQLQQVYNYSIKFYFIFKSPGDYQ